MRSRAVRERNATRGGSSSSSGALMNCNPRSSPKVEPGPGECLIPGQLPRGWKLSPGKQVLPAEVDGIGPIDPACRDRRLSGDDRRPRERRDLLAHDLSLASRVFPGDLS